MMKSKLALILIASTVLTGCLTSEPLIPEQQAVKDAKQAKAQKVDDLIANKYCKVIALAKSYMDKNKEDLGNYVANPQCVYFKENRTLKGYVKEKQNSGNIAFIMNFAQNAKKSGNFLRATSAKIPEYVVAMGKVAEGQYRKVYSHGVSETSMLYVSKTNEFKKLVKLHADYTKKKKA